MNQNCEHIYKLNPLVEQSIRISKITKYGQFHLRLRPSWILFAFCLLQDRERALMVQNAPLVCLCSMFCICSKSQSIFGSRKRKGKVSGPHTLEKGFCFHNQFSTDLPSTFPVYVFLINFQSCKKP